MAMFVGWTVMLTSIANVCHFIILCIEDIVNCCCCCCRCHTAAAAAAAAAATLLLPHMLLIWNLFLVVVVVASDADKDDILHQLMNASDLAEQVTLMRLVRLMRYVGLLLSVDFRT